MKPELQDLAFGRQMLPKHEEPVITDAELRCADQISDEEFFERIAMPELIGKQARWVRGKTS
jgi:hypothetical protein